MLKMDTSGIETKKAWLEIRQVDIQLSNFMTHGIRRFNAALKRALQ